MDPKRLKLFGLTRFRNPIDLDLSSLPLGLICVLGDNGEGKSTIMESMCPAALFRRFVTRENRLIIDYATERKSYLDLTFDHDEHVYRALHQLDPQANGGRGKGEAFLFQDGEPVSDGKLPDFDRAVKEFFPSRAVLLSSIYATQNGDGNFTGLSKAERRDLFAELLGLGEMQALADRAKKQRATCDAAAADVEEERERAAVDLTRWNELSVSRHLLEPELSGARAKLKASVDATVEARTAVQAAKVASQGAKGERDRTVERRGQLEARKLLLAGRSVTHNDEIKTAKRVLENAEQIEAEAALMTKLDEERIELGARWRELSKRPRGAAEWLVEGDTIEGLNVSIAAAELAERETFAAEHDAQIEGRKHRSVDVIGAQLERAEADAALIESVPCEGIDGLETSDARYLDCSTCSLLGAATSARAQLPALRSELQASEESAVFVAAAVATQRQKLAEIQVLKQRLTALEGAGVVAEIASVSARGKAVAEEMKRLEHASDILLLRDARAKEKQVRKALETNAEDLAAVALDLEALPTIDNAKIEKLRQALVKAEAALSACVDSERIKRLAHDECSAKLQRATGALDLLGDVQARVDALDMRALLIGRRRTGFALLERALGRDGVQAIEIDAAGPEVSTLATDLLHECYGARFSLELQTVRPAEGARKQKEVFDLIVHDGERGRSGRFEDLSGGEQVVVDEALKLAIAVFNSRRHGNLRTLWRDESDGRLSPARAAAFPSMLRKALDLGGFDRLYFVSHRPEVQAQADARIVVSGGKAVIS